MYSRLSKSVIALPVLSSFSLSAVEITDNIFASGFVAVGSANYRSYEPDTKDWDRAWHHMFEGGLTLSATLPYNLEFNAQGLYRDFDDLSHGSEFKVDYASLDWRNAALGYGEQTVSLGRIKSGGGIYNHTRDMPFTRPSIMLPNSVYMEDFRSVYSHIDGMRLASNFYIGAGDLRMELAIGEADLGENFIGDLYSAESNSTWQQDGATYFDIRYQNAHWLLTYSRTSVDADYNGSMTMLSLSGRPIIYSGNSTLDLVNNSFGIQYQHQYLEATVEYSEQTIDAFNDESNSGVKRNIDGYYAQLKYFLMPDVSLLTRYEKLNFDIEWDVRTLSPIGLIDSKQYAVGVNWRINPQWQLNVEGYKNKSAYWDEDLVMVEAAWRF